MVPSFVRGETSLVMKLLMSQTHLKWKYFTYQEQVIKLMFAHYTLKTGNQNNLIGYSSRTANQIDTHTRDGGLEDRPRSRGRPRDLILMASISVLVSAAHVSVSVLVSEVPALSTGSRQQAGLET